MSFVIRLKRIGKKNRPEYKIVATEKRSKLSSVTKELGHYNPLITPPFLKIDKEEFEKCLKNGAKLSSGAKKILHD